MTVTTEMQKLMDQLLAEVADIKLKQAHPPITIDLGKQTQGHSRVSPRVYTLQEKMEMRMGWIPNRPPSSFASVEYHRLNDKVFVWVLTKEEQSVVLEDEHALFPSDALITKVRMMGG